MFIEYVYIFKYFFFAILISLFLFCLSFFFVYQVANSEKATSYECGFNPFGDARVKFEIKFYLIGILFIIFDLELVYLFPWILIVNSVNLLGIYGMLIFMFVLTLGFLYEWLSGALDW